MPNMGQTLRIVCKKPKGCGRKFSKPMGSRRQYCETCSPPRGKTTADVAAVVPGPGSPGWTPGRIESRALAELTERGRADTLEGEVVLRLARELDSGRLSGASLTSCAKQLLEAKRAAVEGTTPPEKDRLDQLAEQRARKAETA